MNGILTKLWVISRIIRSLGTKGDNAPGAASGNKLAQDLFCMRKKYGACQQVIVKASWLLAKAGKPDGLGYSFLATWLGTADDDEFDAAYEYAWVESTCGKLTEVGWEDMSISHDGWKFERDGLAIEAGAFFFAGFKALAVKDPCSKEWGQLPQGLCLYRDTLVGWGFDVVEYPSHMQSDCMFWAAATTVLEAIYIAENPAVLQGEDYDESLLGTETLGRLGDPDSKSGSSE